MGGQACEICAGTDVLDLLLSLLLDAYARIESRGGGWFFVLKYNPDTAYNVFIPI